MSTGIVAPLLLFLSSSAIAFTPPHSSPLVSHGRLASCLKGRQSFVSPSLRSCRESSLRVSMAAASQPKIIQGGMGVQVSSWNLAREVSRSGELGVVSGTALDTVLCRWMQLGDPKGLYRRALSNFPDQLMVKRFMDKYYIEGGKDPSKSFKALPMWTLDYNQDLTEACVMGNFAEVWLAKHEDDDTPTKSERLGYVGINCLTKIQLPTVASLYGAMLADVDYVLMGAGIPMEVPGILDKLAKQQDTKLAIDVDYKDGPAWFPFSPKEFWTKAGRPDLATKQLKRPNFMPIVSSVMLAQAMLKRATGEGPTRGIQGFIVEMPTAGGHNAPPRGFKYDPAKKSHTLSLNERGEPIYGEKDEVDLIKFRDATKGLPFYLAGYYARPEKLQEILAIGGAGIQVGTSFAFSQESGLDPIAKQAVLKAVQKGDLSVFTDPVASPTGFPFKVLELEGSVSTPEGYKARPRVCNLGYLRTPYVRPEDGRTAYRCASEPIQDYIKKGGDISATEGRKCLCNGLMANAGMPQVSPYKKVGSDEKYIENWLITTGDDINQIRRFIKDSGDGSLAYQAKDVVSYLLGRFKEELQSERNLYNDADKAEDPAVRQRLLEKRSDIDGKIKDVSQQLGGLK